MDKALYEATPENEAAEEAAFEATFEGTDLEPAFDGETEEPAGEVPPNGEETQTEPAAEPQTPSITDLMAMLEDQKRESQKTVDRVFGKLGELQQRIEAAKSSVSGISPKARERLAGEFPELAEMLFDGGEPEPQQTQQTAPTYTPPAVDTEVVESVKRDFEKKLLKRDHPDWEQVVGSPDFANWAETVLSPEDAATLNSTWDSDYVSGKLDEYKKWKVAQTKKTQQKQAQQNKLESAVVPRGNPGGRTSGYSADDEEAAMLEAFGKRY